MNLKDITVKKLVQEAELSRQTFYNNYYSIQEFLYDIETKKIEEIKNAIFESVAEFQILSKDTYSS